MMVAAKAGRRGAVEPQPTLLFLSILAWFHRYGGPILTNILLEGRYANHDQSHKYR